MKKVWFVSVLILFVGTFWGAARPTKKKKITSKMRITNNTKRELIFLTNLALYSPGGDIFPSLIYLKPGKTGEIDAPNYFLKLSEMVIANPMIVIFRDELDSGVDGAKPFHPAVKQICERSIGEVDEIAALKDKLLGTPKQNSLPAFRLEEHFAGNPRYKIIFEEDLLHMNPDSLVENNAVRVITGRHSVHQIPLVRLPSSLFRVSNFINNSFDPVELLFSNAGNRVRVPSRRTVWFDASKTPPMVIVNGQKFKPLSVIEGDIKHFQIAYNVTPTGDKILLGIMKNKNGDDVLLDYALVEEGEVSMAVSSSSAPLSSIEDGNAPVRRASHARKVKFDLPEDFQEKETRQKIAKGIYRPAFSSKKK